MYISSSVIYERVETFPLAERDTEDMLPPFTDYGLSKLVGERLWRGVSEGLWAALHHLGGPSTSSLLRRRRTQCRA